MAAVTTTEKSAWLSKINWAQLIGMGASLLTAFGFTVPPDLIPATVAAITAVQAILTIVMRTWFTTQLTPASVAVAGLK